LYQRSVSRVVAVTTKGQRGEQSSFFLCPALSTTWLRTTDDASCSMQHAVAVGLI